MRSAIVVFLLAFAAAADVHDDLSLLQTRANLMADGEDEETIDEADEDEIDDGEEDNGKLKCKSWCSNSKKPWSKKCNKKKCFGCAECPPPTPSPTPNPTPSPTPFPTPVPTPSPTPVPTPVPTPSPTPVPTPNPTPPPTPSPTPSTDATYTYWNDAAYDTFAGQGSCSAQWSEQDVANRWCQILGHGVGVSWSPVTGPQRTNYINGDLLQGTPTKFAGYGCSSSCKCFKQLKCSSIALKLFTYWTDPSYPVFAGQGSCDSSNSEQDVADRWCTILGATHGISWANVQGSQNVNYIKGVLGSGTPTIFSGYGCASSCKCFKNLECTG